MHHHTVRNILIAFILMTLVTLGAYIVFATSGKTKNISSPVTTDIQEISDIAQAKEPEIKQVRATSLDGGKTLTMKVASGDSGALEYSFSIDEGPTFFSEVLEPSSTLSLTYNSWEPTDKFVYVAVDKNGVKDAYVFNANGENFADGQKFMSAQDYFSRRNITYKFDEATGWGGNGLLQIKTVKEDGTKGPNFWFEIPSGAVLQLAH